MSFDKLVYGQQKWNDIYNSNLGKTQEVQDTGWQQLVIVAPATGTLRTRVINGYMCFQGTVIPNATGPVTLANMPFTNASNMHIVGSDIDGQVPAYLSITVDSNLVTYNLTSTNSAHKISLDGISIYVGNINPGGVIDLLNHWLSTISNHFNNRLEVA